MARQRINRRILDWFQLYVRFYLRRNFHAVRLLEGTRRDLPPDLPLIICLNHPSWWDPLIALFLSRALFPRREHFGPIESAALAKYKFFEKLGFFGIEPGTRRGAAAFLRTGREILSKPQSALWITAQGAFTDVRQRPVALRGGVGHLIRRLDRVCVLPLAVEYCFWNERYPEALLAWGEPLMITGGAERSADEWTAKIAAGLETAQDRLQPAATKRDGALFETLLGGNAGVGGVYDLWRRARAGVRGEEFERAHQTEKA